MSEGRADIWISAENVVASNVDSQSTHFKSAAVIHGDPSPVGAILITAGYDYTAVFLCREKLVMFASFRTTVGVGEVELPRERLIGRSLEDNLCEHVQLTHGSKLRDF